MKEMEVVLMSSTPTPELICARAMRSCRTLEAAHELPMTHDDARRLIKAAKKMGHFGVLEFAHFTFSVKNVSRALTHQFVRHRLFSFCQQSQRAVDVEGEDNKPSYIYPDSIQMMGEDAVQDYDMMMEEIFTSYTRFKDVYKMEPEDARFLLPNACATNIVVSGNARVWLHFFKLRLDPHAQWEIRKMAKIMYEECLRLAPSIFEEIPISV